MWSNIKLLLKNMCHQKMYNYTFRWLMIMMKYLSTINKQACPDKPTSKLKLLKT